MDGSEIRGSHNATVIAQYGDKTGNAAFTVWMPEIPLMVYFDDAKLSQIRGWRAPDPTQGHFYGTKFRDNFLSPNSNDIGEDPSCSIIYQQTPVQVIILLLNQLIFSLNL